MFLIIGLGNPGKEYEGTRHNVGREIVDAISRNAECRMQNAEWRTKKSLHAETFECAFKDHPIILAKPTTYMNESGKTAAAIVKGYRLLAIGLSREALAKWGYRLVVIHDDLDLPVGALRLSTGGSSGGQKGVQSIIAALGTNDFIRLRVGIGPNETPDGHRIPAEKFVLERFRTTERSKIDTTVARAVEAIEILIRDGLPTARQFANG